jgi:hypothetical protein
MLSRRFLNDKPNDKVYSPTMTKLIALVAAGLFAAGPVFAGQHGNCTKQVGNQTVAACQVSTANLNLSSEQKTKMDALSAEHKKEGCSRATEAEYMQKAKSILTKSQYAKFKTECKEGERGKTA